MMIEKCPHCGSMAIKYNHIRCGGYGYWIECWDCHWCGQTKLFLRWAWRAWNREARDIKQCYGCKNKYNEHCPNSGMCYDLPYKPFYEKEAAEKPQPLTKEKLRKMDGEPVWLKDGIGEGWFLTGAVYGSKIYFCEKAITVGKPLSECGKSWLAYRTKPETEKGDRT